MYFNRMGLTSVTLDTPDLKRAADHDESPPLTPTGNAPSSESELDISSPNPSHDESQAKDQGSRDLDKDLSHRPKRRRCHETYNFNMKCPTPGCNSLGKFPSESPYSFKEKNKTTKSEWNSTVYWKCLFQPVQAILQENMNVILLYRVARFTTISQLMNARWVF